MNGAKPKAKSMLYAEVNPVLTSILVAKVRYFFGMAKKIPYFFYLLPCFCGQGCHHRCYSPCRYTTKPPRRPVGKIPLMTSIWSFDVEASLTAS